MYAMTYVYLYVHTHTHTATTIIKIIKEIQGKIPVNIVIVLGGLANAIRKENNWCLRNSEGKGGDSPFVNLWKSYRKIFQRVQL